MIESTWDLFLKSFLVVADITSKGRGHEPASWWTASTQSRQSSTRTWFLPLRFSRPRDIIHVHRLLFQGESEFKGFKGDKGNIKGPGEQRERQLQGVVHFFSNMHMIHVFMSIFQWESEFWGYKSDKGHIKGPGEQRELQPQGSGQGVVHFFQIYRVRRSNCSQYIMEPGESHMHLKGQNEVSLEPHNPQKDFEISHAQIGHS